MKCIDQEKMEVIYIIFYLFKNVFNVSKATYEVVKLGELSNTAKSFRKCS